MNQDKIRNFCIIAHIDHGKSTLADRMMELTGTVEKRAMKSQLLDSMELERERGITIKLAPVRMRWSSNQSRKNILQHKILHKQDSLVCDEVYDLNLIDTPGHVDFSYEVSRSLAACEGAVLVVDASQGIQAQTLANVYLAMEQDLTIIPVLNKIDLPAADVARVSKEITNLLSCDESDILKISAKTGEGVEQVLNRIIEKIPPPVSPLAVIADTSSVIASAAKQFSRSSEVPTRALIFDSYYDDYRGVILYVRVVDGEIKKNDEVKMLATAAHGIALEVGHLSPKMTADPVLATGEIGYIVTNLKTTRDAKVGDTVTLKKYFDKEAK
jgi:GTP-binding protein LepA